MVDQFISNALDQQKYTKTNHQMWACGSDFQYSQITNYSILKRGSDAIICDWICDFQYSQITNHKL